MSADSHPSLSHRLKNYSRGAGQVSRGMAAAAAASWSLVAVQSSEAVVNTFTFSSPPIANSWTRSAGPTNFSGAFDSLWRGGNQFIKVRVIAQGAGLDYVGATVALSAPIGTGAAFPTMTDVTSVGAAAIFPLRVNNGTDNFFGWLRTTGGSTRTVGFSDVPNRGVFAGTTTEFNIVPEPTTALPLLLLGATGVALNRRRRAAQASA